MFWKLVWRLSCKTRALRECKPLLRDVVCLFPQKWLILEKVQIIRILYLWKLRLVEVCAIWVLSSCYILQLPYFDKNNLDWTWQFKIQFKSSQANNWKNWNWGTLFPQVNVHVIVVWTKICISYKLYLNSRYS